MKYARAIWLLLLASACSVAQSPTNTRNSTKPEGAAPAASTSDELNGEKNDLAKSEKARQKKDEADRLEVRRQKALDFIKRSHALNDQISDRQRMGLFNVQINTAGRLDRGLAREWARELFTLGATMKPSSGTSAQLYAVKALVNSDPDEAISMLGRIEPAFLAHSWHEFPGASLTDHSIFEVFSAYGKAKGKSGMVGVLKTAGMLGNAGRYPYTGVMAAADAVNDRALAAEVVTALITRFQSRIDPAQSSYDFAKMLVDNEKFIPKSLLKPAVDAAAEAIENYPLNDDNKNYYVAKNFAKGSVTAHGPVEIGLIELAPMLKRVDPELAEQLGKRYATFAQPAAELDWNTGGGGDTVMGFSGESNQVVEPTDQRDAILSALTHHVWRDEDRGAKALSQVSDPSIRAEAYSSAAQQMAPIDPATSAAFAAEAERSAAQIDDSMTKFRALAARVQADAANEQHAAVRQELELVFRMADRLLRKDADEKDNKRGYWEVTSILRDVVRNTARIEPDLTAANIENLQLPEDRAMLLAEAASVLAPPVNMPTPTAK